MHHDLNMQKILLMTSTTAIQSSHARSDNNKIEWYKVNKVQMANWMLTMLRHTLLNSVKLRQISSKKLTNKVEKQQTLTTNNLNYHSYWPH